MTQTRWTDQEAVAFAEAAAAVPENQVTACRAWTAHDLLAHVVAGGAEIVRLVQDHVDGRPSSPTTSFEDREPAFRALPYADLVGLVADGGLLDLLDRAADTSEDGPIDFTGWAMTADSLAMHVRSELAIHRWDLIGSDPIGVELLGQPEFTAHALRSLTRFDTIAERAEMRTRTVGCAASAPVEVRLRVDGEPDVVITASASSTEVAFAQADDTPAITTDAAGRLLLLWGRRPPPAHAVTTDLDHDALVLAERWLLGP